MKHHAAGLARVMVEMHETAQSAEALTDQLVARAKEFRAGQPMAVTHLATSRERALLEYALKLTARPAQMTRADVEALRGAGMDDGEILDANQVTAYYAYVNRLVDGLGVELEWFHREASGPGSPTVSERPDSRGTDRPRR
ncbi:MAG: hypothetical protein B7733_14225 [Myxococcales bacterium FL481]|nr:MAG: hypothetical protein B7733_14225 [Myxococcales bacterium FL481]